jgi:hypothetical protein
MRFEALIHTKLNRIWDYTLTLTNLGWRTLRMDRERYNSNISLEE